MSEVITISKSTAKTALSALEYRYKCISDDVAYRGDSQDGVTKILRQSLVTEGAAIAELKSVLTPTGE